ncbi:MAG: glycosyltransferase family 9 protein [Candidatus Paceibacterota bacterium]|jgi:ADP-heptose:LPS heptosyltransferase
MTGKKINYEYLNLYQEIPLLLALSVERLFRTKPRETGHATLIVNTCLIGEFAASLPAVRDYILRQGGHEVDLLVSPPLKSLAERVRGVRKVYVARSLYGRRNEDDSGSAQQFPAYDTIFVMRISTDAFRHIRGISARVVRTGLREYSRYALHLWWSLILRRLPMQWRELNFNMLGGEMRDIPFDDLFQCTESDLASVASLEELKTSEKKIIIHTGAGWVMKHWERDKWVALLGRIQALGGVRFIFVGGDDDAEEAAAIASHLGFPTYSLVGKISLLQLLLVLRQSDYFIGTDSGPRNMAHLADTRSVTILGPGPHFYMPWDSRDIAIDKTRGRGVIQMFLSAEHGFTHEITVEEVYDAFIQLWNL